MQSIQSIRTVVLLGLFVTASWALAGSPSYVVDEMGIYKVDAAGKRERIYRSNKSESLMDSTFSVSPNKNWALVDFVPSNPGKGGRVEEIRILVSLANGARLDQEKFQSKYGAWLDESAEWADDKPATIVLGRGKNVQVK